MRFHQLGCASYGIGLNWCEVRVVQRGRYDFPLRKYTLELRVVVDSNADLSPLEARFRAALGINMNAVQIVDSLEGPMVTDSR